jgi:hypothetical protein
MGINLRTNKGADEMSMCELQYNDCYVKDREAYYRDYDTDMSARDLIRSAYEANKKPLPAECKEDNEALDMFLYDNLQYGIDNFDGIMALLYQQLWTKAEIRQILIKATERADLSDLI